MTETEHFVPVTVPGDLWQLESNRILCGSAAEVDSYSAVMGGRKANVILADLSANFTPLDLIFNLLISHSVEGSIHFVFGGSRRMEEILMAGRASNGGLNDLCIGVKDKPEKGSFYRNQHELVFVFKPGTNCSQGDCETGRISTERSNVWRYPRCKSRSRSGDSGSHARRPVSVVADAIVDCSARGDMVLDPFLGTGAALIAAERTGRICTASRSIPT